MESIVNFKGELKNGIAATGFSPSGKYFAAVEKDPDHLIAVYDTNLKSKVLNTIEDTA